MILDDKDRMIIRLLEENSRYSIREIAGKVGLSHMAVYKRIRKLVDSGVIKKFSVVVDPSNLGYSCAYYIMVRVKQGYDPIKIGELIKGLGGVSMVNIIASDYDILVLTRCLSKDEAYDVLTKVRRLEGVERATPVYIIKTL